MVEMVVGVKTQTIAITVVGVAIAALCGAAMADSPILFVLILTALFGVHMLTRYGFDVATVVGALLVFTLPAPLSAFGGIASELSMVAVAAILLVAVRNYRFISLTSVEKMSISIVLVVSAIFLIYRFFAHPVYAVTGWVSILAPVFAVGAGAGLFGRLSTVDLASFRRATRLLVGVVCFVLFLNVGTGLAQSFFGLSAGEVVRVERAGSTYLVDGVARSVGLFDSSQTFGLLLALLAPFVLFYGFSRSGAARVVLVTLGIAALVALFLSLLRGAMFGAFAAVLIGLLLPASFGARGHRAAVIAVPVSLLTGLVVAFSQGSGTRWGAAWDRFSSVFSLSEDVSFNARQSETLPLAWKVFVENPIGLGGGASGPVSQTYAEFAPAGPITTDNGYLNLAIQLGIVGFLFLVICLLSMATRLMKSTSSFARASSMSLVSLLVAMIFGGYWNLTGPMVVAGIVVGIGLAYSGLEDDRTRGNPGFDSLSINPGGARKSLIVQND